MSSAFHGSHLTKEVSIPRIECPPSISRTECHSTQGSPFLSLPVQSPKPEVLAPDTSCSNVALGVGRRGQK